MSNYKAKILLVEDEKELSDILTEYLSIEGYQVTPEYRGDRVVSLVKQLQPELIILDRHLPGADGLEICQVLRTFSNVAIIMLTAKVAEIDRLVGLDSGADDYICKPVTPKEVVARVNAVLRRFQHINDNQKTGLKLKLDEDYLQGFWNKQNLGLTPVEFRILRILMQSTQGIGSRTRLMNAAYEDGRHVSERTIDSHVKNLRAKITACSKLSNPIKSVYGVGYQLSLEQ